jgi:hypothetical protein
MVNDPLNVCLGEYVAVSEAGFTPLENEKSTALVDVSVVAVDVLLPIITSVNAKLLTLNK